MIQGLSDFYKTKGISTSVLTKRWPAELTERGTLNEQNIYRVTSAKTEQEHYDVARALLDNEEELRADVIHVIGIRRPLPMFALLLAAKWNGPLVLTVAGDEIPHTLNESS